MSPRYAVFGQPIAHSLSPRIHAAFGDQLGIAVDYRAIEAGRDSFAGRLAEFVDDGGRGANVTLPLKEDALTLCVGVSERARRAGSVNTLIRDGDSWRGDSTDGVGLLRDLQGRHGVRLDGARVLLLGAGGAARAAAFALLDAGAATLAIANRGFERAQALADSLGAAASAQPWPSLHGLGTFDLVINATSAGHGADTFDLPRGLLAAGPTCYDLSYGKAAQAFIHAARSAGATRVHDGLGMLVEQAAESFLLWHGLRPQTAPVHAVLASLATAVSR